MVPQSLFSGGEASDPVQAEKRDEGSDGPAISSDLGCLAVARTLSERRPNTQKKFVSLAEAWRKERDESSSSSLAMAMCPSYQKIIGLGMEAIPLILVELERRVDHWFWALNAITDENPVLPSHAGDFTAAAEDWIAWGRRHGFI